MIHISFDAHSCIRYLKEKGREKKFNLGVNNRGDETIFVKGAVLNLMGECVSIYRLEDDRGEAFNIAAKAFKKLINGWNIKYKYTYSRYCTENMTFSQYRKSGYVKTGGIGYEKGAYNKNKQMMNQRYLPFIKKGLFSAFDLSDQTVLRMPKNINTLMQEAATILNRVNDDNTADLQRISEGLNCLFNEIPASQYPPSMNRIADLFEPVCKTVKSKIKKDSDFDFNEVLLVPRVRLLLYATSYLSMVVELEKGKGKSTSFGLPTLDFKKAEKLSQLAKGLFDAEAFTKVANIKVSPDGATEFYKGFFDTTYTASTRNVVESGRYDGGFDVFIKCDEVEQEKIIIDQIENSGVYLVRLGKSGYARLSCPPQHIPNSMWDEMTKDSLPKQQKEAS